MRQSVSDRRRGRDGADEESEWESEASGIDLTECSASRNLGRALARGPFRVLRDESRPRMLSRLVRVGYETQRTRSSSVSEAFRHVCGFERG